MAERMGYGLIRWLGKRCAAHRLRAGSRQRDQLLRRLGQASGAAAGHRLPSGAWKAHGEAAYRRFKWDPAQVPAEVRVRCRQLLALEARLSTLARQLGAGAEMRFSRHPAPCPSVPALGAGRTL
ncbi:MAG TPA: hypothetical protein VIG69_06995 [Candidatus Methylomirabilis sp.]